MNARDILPTFYASRPEFAPRAPDAAMVAGADLYCVRYGRQRPAIQWSDVYVPSSRGRAIARAYEALPAWDDDALPAYRAFRDETQDQYAFLTRRLGVRVSVASSDPYGNYAELLQDLARGRLAVLSTASTGGHPFFTDAQNDAFRAVHDAFGHCATGRAFDRHGEDAAWASHSSMYSRLARRAMSTETRGQNSAMVFGANPGEFPAEKIAVLPARFVFGGVTL